jgi:hypothetical protein
MSYSASCVVMSLEEHLPNGDKTPLAIELEATESYFLGIFCVESCLKASCKLLWFKIALILEY